MTKILNFIWTTLIGFGILFGITGSLLIANFVYVNYKNTILLVALGVSVVCISYIFGRFAREIVSFFKK